MADKKKRKIEDLGVKLLVGITLVVIGICVFTAFAVSTRRETASTLDMVLTIALGLIPTGIGFYMLSDGVSMICHTVESLETKAAELEKELTRIRRRQK
jgi:drug/metabolite transporter (DMT)-like permease